MPLVLGNQRLDLRQFPHLMPHRIRVGTDEFFAATSTRSRLARDDVRAIFNRNERPLCLAMSRLPAAVLLRLGFLPRRLGMWMPRRRRQRRVLRRLPQSRQLRLQLRQFRPQRRDLRKQQPNDRLRLRRLTSNQFCGNLQRHARDIADSPKSRNPNLPHRPVNGYRQTMHSSKGGHPCCCSNVMADSGV